MGFLLTEDNNEDKIAKGKIKCVRKRYNKPARKNKVHVERLWRFTSKKYNVFTEKLT